MIVSATDDAKAVGETKLKVCAFGRFVCHF